MNKKYNVGPKQYFTYGMGNFASQLSWTMVSTYLAVFYTDVFGISTGAVAILFLVAKIWDGINDPMMGTIMERTHTRWGRFRPYIAIGAPMLVVFTILTFCKLFRISKTKVRLSDYSRTFRTSRFAYVLGMRKDL